MWLQSVDRIRLRAAPADTHSNADAYAYEHSNSHAYAYEHSNANTDSDEYSNANTDSDEYSNANANANRDEYTRSRPRHLERDLDADGQRLDFSQSRLDI